MQRIVYGFLGFLGLLLGIVLIVPFFLNINDYKPQIQAEAKKALGRDVFIDGDLSLSFLPSPQLSLHKVRIINIMGGTSQDFLRIKRIRVAASLLPLFKKHVKIKSLELDKPEINLEKLGDGRTNWTFPTLLTPSVPSSSTLTPSSSSFEVDFEKIKITNGRLVYLAKGQEIKIQNINTHAKIDSLQGPYAIEGTLSAYGQDIKIDGNFGTPTDPEHVRLKIRVDEAVSTFDGKMSLSSLTFKGNLKATADTKMFKNLSSKHKASSFLAGMLRMDAEIITNADGASFNKAQFDIGSAHPAGDLKVLWRNGLQVEANLKNLPGQSQCTFTLSPSDQGLKGNINATVPHGKELLNWLTIETDSFPPALLSALTLSTHYIFGEDVISLKDLTLMIGGAKLQGDASWQTQKKAPLVIVDLETPKLENILKLLGVKNPKPLGHSMFKGKVQVDATTLHLKNLKGQLGKNFSFEGNIAVDYRGAKPQIKAILSVNSINLETLLAAKQTESSQFPEGKIYLISAKHKPSHSHSNPRWSNEPIDFSFLEKFDGQFEITSSQLTRKDIVVMHPKLSAKVQNGRLDISSLTGSIYGGMFRGSGHLMADNTMHFHILLQDASLKKLLSHGSNIKIVGGKLTLSSDLSTHGKSIADMIQHLAGPVNITAMDGVINGFDLHTISQRLGNLQNLQSVLGLLNTHMGKGQTPFSSFKADIVFMEGVGTIQSMHFVAKEGQGHASGQIDLPRYTVDIHAEFHLTEHPKIPPFLMHLSGSIDNPSRQLDTSVLRKYMVENVFKGVIEKLGKGKFKPADMLGSILGEGNESSNNNAGKPAPQAGSSDKPEKIVKEIFKRIF